MIERVDLNADLGEGAGDDAAMLAVVSSASIACGGHAGDAESMRSALDEAASNGVSVGAHPSFEDRSSFGRRMLRLSARELQVSLANQIETLITAAEATGSSVRYVKLHGALANQAGADREVARTVVETLDSLDASLPLLAISGTKLEMEAREAGLVAYSEVFADRGYRPDGQLVTRGEPGAMILDREEATERMLAFLETGLMPTVGGGPIPLAADSICVHGDNPAAAAMARALRSAIQGAGVKVRGFLDTDESSG